MPAPPKEILQTLNTEQLNAWECAEAYHHAKLAGDIANLTVGDPNFAQNYQSYQMEMELINKNRAAIIDEIKSRNPGPNSK